jgi:hypothetical protein
VNYKSQTTGPNVLFRGKVLENDGYVYLLYDVTQLSQASIKDIAINI